MIFHCFSLQPRASLGAVSRFIVRSRYRFLGKFPEVDTVGEKFTVTGTVGE